MKIVQASMNQARKINQGSEVQVVKLISDARADSTCLLAWVVSGFLDLSALNFPWSTRYMYSAKGRERYPEAQRVQVPNI